MTPGPLRLVIAGGGTGGHVQPAIATLQALRARLPVEPLWLGSRSGLERAIAAEHGVPFRSIATGKLRRYLSLRTPLDALRVPLGTFQAFLHLRSLRPAVVLSTGGFVSVPTVVAARLLRIPSLTHEQTATVGLATRINARFCDVVALSYESSRSQLGSDPPRVVVTGNPVRRSLFGGLAFEGFRAFGMDPEIPLIYVTGGALGAHAINCAVEAALGALLPCFQIVHQCGPTNGNQDEPRLLRARDALPETLKARYAVRAFIGPELPDLLAAASLVVGRSGAGTVAELAALRKPSILIPLPGTGGDEQTVNARVLASAGAAVLLPQTELTPDRLASEIMSLFEGDRLSAMGRNASGIGRRDAADRLAEELLSLVRESTAHSMD